MIRKMLIILACLSIIGCSTSSSIKKIQTGGDWSGFKHTHFCPAYHFSEDGKMATPLNILDKNHISLAGPDCELAIKKAREYVSKQYGNTFLDRSNFYDIDIVYWDSITAFERRGPKPDSIKCGNTKYFIRFLLDQGKDIQYRFGIAMNEKFEIISPAEFANFDKNITALPIIGAMEAHMIAIKKHPRLIRKTDEIKLTYNKETNRFIWEINGEKKYLSRNTKLLKRPIKYGVVEVDAATGEIIHAEMKKGYVLVNARYF